MKTYKSPWLKNIANDREYYRFATWDHDCEYTPVFRGSMRVTHEPWICHYKLKKLFDLDNVNQLRVVLTDKPPEGHYVELTEYNPYYYDRSLISYRINGSSLMLFTNLENWLRMIITERFKTTVAYAQLEVK